MGRMIIDAAASLDGFWADAGGKRVFSEKDLQGSGLSGRLSGVCGAVVMSRRSFESSDDKGWIAEAYAGQTPIFVVTDDLANDANRIRFVSSYAEAFAQAAQVAGEAAVLVVGEAGALKAAMRTGDADEIWLRLMLRTLGGGASLFEDGIPVADYFVSEMETGPDAVHMHLEKRLAT